MAAYTTADAKAAGAQGISIATDFSSLPGRFAIEATIDFAKVNYTAMTGAPTAFALNDTLALFDIPTYSSAIVDCASLNVITACAASSTVEVGIAGTAVTTLTGLATSSVAKVSAIQGGTNTVTTTSSASTLTLKFTGAAPGTLGKYRIRIHGLLSSPT